MYSRTLLAVSLIASLALAGCAGDKKRDGTTTSTTTGDNPPADHVWMKNLEFVPMEITVNVGDTVTWTNKDAFGHDVKGDDFDSGAVGGIAAGQTFTHTFTEAGVAEYYCRSHSSGVGNGMWGKVTVTA